MNIVIPSGSLYEATIALFKKIGLIFSFEARKFIAKVNGDNLITTAFLDRPQDVPFGIAREKYDMGICGWDCVVESGLEEDLVKVEELKYSKKSRGAAKVVVFGKTDQLIDNEQILVASEYPRLARTVFKKARVIYSNGCTEGKILYGGYDYGIGVTETGASLEINGLKVVAKILESPTVLIAHRETPEIKFLGQILRGALQAERKAVLKFNCTGKIKKNVLAWLPAIDAPTVNKLSNGGFAIETVLSKEDLTNQLIRLRFAGATGIVVQDLNVVL